MIGKVSGLTAFDHRGHGVSERGRIPVSWWELALDVEAVLGRLGGAVIGVGHSMGATTLVMAEAIRPGRFAGLVLIEPIIIPLPAHRADHPIVAGARKRRRHFASAEEARAKLTAKPPLSLWVPEAVDGYLEGGLVADDNGVRLACDPEFEAEIYTAAAAHGLIGWLDRVKVPVTVIAGADSTSYPLEWAKHLAGEFQQGRLEPVAEADHFIPMTHPELVVAAIAEMVDQVEPATRRY